MSNCWVCLTSGPTGVKARKLVLLTSVESTGNVKLHGEVKDLVLLHRAACDGSHAAVNHLEARVQVSKNSDKRTKCWIRIQTQALILYDPKGSQIQSIIEDFWHLRADKHSLLFTSSHSANNRHSSIHQAHKRGMETAPHRDTSLVLICCGWPHCLSFFFLPHSHHLFLSL